MRNRPLLAEAVPDGTFGGARPRPGSQKRTTPDPDGPRRLAELGREVAAYDAANRARRRAGMTAERKTAA